ncbi:9181_t:CDS:2 [Funneliformis mosseae]|uniref:9181_t:CDS:1 n=1 Tax=Funneliformis mosseae TaxID=27381 RepID=A0A9N9GAF1_FUNMO|nr:9181_t:CDS:2 [Funneliformis mosseae]
MSNIYEIIDSLLEKEESKILQIHLINNPEKENRLLLALKSHEKPEDKKSLLKDFLSNISDELQVKRSGDFQESIRKLAPPRYCEFWLNPYNSQIICIMPPGYIDENVLNSEPYSCYMDVEEDKIVLKNNVMINSENILILNDGKPVEVRLNEGEECKLVVSGHIKLDKCAKFLRLCKLPESIVRGVTKQCIYIKESYLKMIELIETDREKLSLNGCVIIGTPGTGKTHFSLYFAFFIMRRYQETDIIFEQLCKNTDEGLILRIKPNKSVMIISDLISEDPVNSYYIVDSIAPTDVGTKFTLLLTTPRNDRWHEFEKKDGVMKYYSSLWVEKEILDVWKLNYNSIPEGRVKELINVWGCVPRRIFCEYYKEPKISEVIAKCNVHDYIENEGEDLGDKYSGKAILIRPKQNFTDKEFIPASEIISKALYEKYKNSTKDSIISLIKNLAGGAAAPLSRKFFEMMAHDLLRKGGTFKVRNLSTGNCEILQLQELKQNVFHNIDEIVSMEFNFPDKNNLKSFDALTPNYNGSNHHLYQMTIAKTHNIKVNGLQEMRSLLDNGSPIHLYFVVPDIDEIYDNYCKQEYHTTKDTIYIGWNKETEWIQKKVTQYVLLIELSDFS